MTVAQRRLYDMIKRYGASAEYWPIVNDWVRDRGPARSLALRNITRTVDALIRGGYVTIDEDGYFQITDLHA